jgi:hypothetical protein
MRDKDTELLEEAYGNVVLNEMDLRKAVKTGAAVAGLALGAFGGADKAQATPANYPQDPDGAAIESRENPELGASASYDLILDLLNPPNSKPIKQILKENPKILNAILAEVKKGNYEIAKDLTYQLQLRKQEIPPFLEKFKKDLSGGMSGG